MISLIDRYIANRVAISTALVLGVLLALTVFFAFMDALKDFGQAKFGLYEMVRYVVLAQPRKIYEVFPVAMLIGALLGLSSLAVNAELVAMRAAGVSVLQIIGSAMKTGLVFAVVATVLGEFVVPAAENMAQVGRAEALAKGVLKQRSGLWMRDGTTFLNVGEVLPDLSLLRVNIYSFEDDIKLRAHTQAERAQFTPEGWRLQRVVESQVSVNGVNIKRSNEQAWNTGITKTVMNVFTVQPEQLSLRNLWQYIYHLERNSQSTERYRLVLWQKVLMPFAVVVMVLLATPFALGQLRGGGLSRRIFAGVLIGLVFVVVSRSFGHFGLIYGIPPLLGALLPPALFLGGALLLLRRNV
jgi:lipopolysaccharide export system permease protein